MLELQGIRKTFYPGTPNEKKALNGVDLHLNAGDFVTIVGSNGAGKSTLFNAISGVFSVDEGTIRLDSKNITNMKEYKRAYDIGRLFQDTMKGTAPNMTIEENLALAYSRKAGKSFFAVNKQDREYFTELLKQLDLGLESRCLPYLSPSCCFWMNIQRRLIQLQPRKYWTSRPESYQKVA